MTLVGDGRPGARQRETLRGGSLTPHLSGCAPGRPRTWLPRSVSQARDALPGLRLPDTLVLQLCAQGRHGPSQTSSSNLCLPCPICIPRGRGYGGSRTKVPETESFPELPWPRNKMPKSVKNLLPVFHLGVCVCFSHPAQTLPERGREEVGENGAEQCLKPAVAERVPRRPCPALRFRERCGLARSRPARSPSELLVFAATSSFYRFGCAERRGYYRSKAVLSLFPRPLPGLCLCSSVTQQKARGAAARPLNGRQCTAAGTGGARRSLHGAAFAAPALTWQAQTEKLWVKVHQGVHIP